MEESDWSTTFLQQRINARLNLEPSERQESGAETAFSCSSSQVRMRGSKCLLIQGQASTPSLSPSSGWVEFVSNCHQFSSKECKNQCSSLKECKILETAAFSFFLSPPSSFPARPFLTSFNSEASFFLISIISMRIRINDFFCMVNACQYKIIFQEEEKGGFSQINSQVTFLLFPKSPMFMKYATLSLSSFNNSRVGALPYSHHVRL